VKDDDGDDFGLDSAGEFSIIPRRDWRLNSWHSQVDLRDEHWNL